jgi:tripartite-type tricarboxylate transporter receptor subunit TctC
MEAGAVRRADAATVLAVAITTAATLAAGAGTVRAAESAWPVRPIRLIAVFPAGGSVDAVARTVAARLSEALKQQVIVDNRAGAGGQLGVEIATRAAPDGYTLVIAANSITTYEVLVPKLGFDYAKDLAPVSLVASAPLVLCTPPTLPVATGPAQVAYARARPGKLNFSSSGTGTSSHLAGELFREMAGLSLVHVPYKGAAPAITDLIGAQVQLMFSSALSMVTLVQGGKLRGLGVSSAQRLPVLPDVPTVAEFLPGYELSPWFGIWAPAATPRPIVEQLSREIHRVLERPDVRDFYARQGALPVANAPDAFARFIRAEAVKWQGLTKRVQPAPN